MHIADIHMYIRKILSRMALATYRKYLATNLQEKSTRAFMLLINFKDKGECMLRFRRFDGGASENLLVDRLKFRPGHTILRLISSIF